MRKSLLLTVMVVLSATAMAQSVNYSISGATHDASLDGSKVYLVSNKSGEPVCIDSAEVADMRFSLGGKVTAPEVVVLHYGNRRQAKILLYDGAKVNVRTGIRTLVNDNGGLNDGYYSLTDTVSQMFTNARRELKSIVGEEQQKAYVDKKNREISDIYFATIEKNKENLLGAVAFSIIATSFKSVEDFDNYSKGIKLLDNVPEIAIHRANLVAVTSTQPGSKFMDFGGTNIDGKPVKLSDYVGKGKYVLVDFWASWCGPCRGEIPNLVELQNRFGGDKFTVLGINVWDKREAFEKSIENSCYPHIYASDNNDATTLYGIKGIPQIILFAPDGTIIERDLRGEAMKILVGKYMSK